MSKDFVGCSKSLQYLDMDILNSVNSGRTSIYSLHYHNISISYEQRKT